MLKTRLYNNQTTHLKFFFGHFRSFLTKNSTQNAMEKIRFDNLALRVLPLDPVDENYVRTVSGACFSRVQPTPVKNPRLVVCSSDALKLIDIDENLQDEKQLAKVFSGNVLLPGMDPAAHCETKI